MTIGQKIISGSLFALLLVVIAGYFGIRASNKAREGSVLEAGMSSLVLKVAEKGTVTFVATLTKDLDEFAQLKEGADQLRGEINDITSVLLEDSAIKNSVNFQSFLAVKDDHDKDQEHAFEIHKELLERQTLFGDSPSVEEAVRQRLRVVLDTTNNFELIKNFGLVEVLSKEAVFQHRDKETVDRWIASIHKFRNTIETTRPDRILLNNVTVYLQTAEIVGDIVVRENEIYADEIKIVSAMRGREIELGVLRKNIVDELYANISRAYRNNASVLILIIVGMLAIIGSTSLFLSRRIIKPIEVLTAVVVKIARGDLGARVPVLSTDEVGILARSFNQMADRLAGYPLELQQEVQGQTKKLTDANRQLHDLLSESYESAKLLVRKDRELTTSMEESERRAVELEGIGKMLVQRDLELTRSSEKLQEADRLKSEFLSIAAHQLRTPTTAVKWIGRSLLDKEFDALTPDQEDAVLKMYSSNERMIELVDQLLNVARIEEGRMVYNFGRADLKKIISETLEGFRHEIKARKIRVHYAPLSAPVIVRGDGEKIEFVLENLIDNAIKYNKENGKLEILIRDEGTSFRVSIGDTGIGIPQDQRHRVFDRFFRAENAILHQTTGTGLGLFVVKNIIDQHGGIVEFTSEEEKGSWFAFTLPKIKPV